MIFKTGASAKKAKELETKVKSGLSELYDKLRDPKTTPEEREKIREILRKMNLRSQQEGRSLRPESPEEKADNGAA